MRCRYGNLRTFRHMKIFCVILLISDYVVAQLSTGRGIALPLPTANEGRLQGQSAVRPSLKSNSPFTIKYEDSEDSIVNPNFGLGIERGSTVPIVNVKTSQRVPGSLQHITNPTQDPSVKSLLNHPVVLKKIQKETSSSSAVRVDSIITAHKQVVSGEIIYLDLKIVETKCRIGTVKISDCEIDQSEDPHICEIAAWSRPWLNSTKIVDEKTKCAEVESDTDFTNWNRGNGVLRSLTNEIDLKELPSFLDEKQVALEAFDYVNRGSDSKFKGQMVQYNLGDIKHDPFTNITTVDVKVDYGFTLCLKFPKRKVDDRICPLDAGRDNYVCTVTVMADPNLTTNLKVIPNEDDEINCKKKEAAEEDLVVPVKAVCMGCPQTVSLNDPNVLKVAAFAVIEYDRTSDETELHTMTKLHKAQTQVVNGIKYYLTLELAETDCRKPLSAVNMNRTLCNQVLNEQTDICELSVVEKPWQKTLEMVSARCYDKSEYSNHNRDEFIVPVIGGSLQSEFSRFTASPTVGSGGLETSFKPTPAVSVPRIATKPSLGTLNFILNEFNRREVDDNDDGLYKVVNVLEFAASRNLEGEVEDIVLELAETACTRKRLVPNCPLKEDEDLEVCFVRVLKGNPNMLLSMNCDDRDSHYRLTTNPVITPYQPVRQPFFVPQTRTLGLPGGPIEQPTNSSNIVSIARFVVDQYNLQSDENELYKLGRIINAYSQVAGAASYTLEIELLETECKKYQPVTDVSKCPVEKREDAEICQAEVTLVSTNGPELSKKLNRIFCDEREDFYSKLMKQIARGNFKTDIARNSAKRSSTDKITSFGEKIADEFDFRSDENNIFVLVKVIDSRTESDGLKHHLRVELAETVCPKYKQRINKTRCAIDIGEEHKICEAAITERPWEKSEEVTNLSCFERDGSREDEDDSREVFYPRVHPSAHARPKFPQSRFRMRQGSFESDESNEKYYLPGSIARQMSRFDSDEIYEGSNDDRSKQFHPIQLFHGSTRFEVDDDEDEDDGDKIRFRFDNDRTIVQPRREKGDNDDDDEDDDVDGKLRGPFRVTQIRDDDEDDRVRITLREPLHNARSNEEEDDEEEGRQRNTRSREDDSDRSRNRRLRKADRQTRSREEDDDDEYDDDDDDKDSQNGFDNDSKSMELLRSVYRSRRLSKKSSDRNKRALLGGSSVVNVDDPAVVAISSFALSDMDAQTQDPRIRRVEEVLEARRQLVSGVLWLLKIRVAYTQCTKGNTLSATELTNCLLDQSEPQFICEIKVYEKPWENQRYVEESKCEPQTGKSR